MLRLPILLGRFFQPINAHGIIQPIKTGVNHAQCFHLPLSAILTLRCSSSLNTKPALQPALQPAQQLPHHPAHYPGEIADIYTQETTASDHKNGDKDFVLHFQNQKLLLNGGGHDGRDGFSVHVSRTGRLYDFHRRPAADAAVTEDKLTVDSLDDVAWKAQTIMLTSLPSIYVALSKIRLTSLVVMTALAGYIVAPAPFALTDCALMCLGTGLNACAANALNQYLEVPYDSQMNRTKNRVLVRGRISPLHAVTFAVASGTTGCLLLYYGLNPLTAALGLGNLLLYAFVYTPSKRRTISNTWIGAVVGAIPPVMGWVACTGAIDEGAVLLGMILYAWQFPHFNALSWNLRPEYSRAGYYMPSVIRPDLCARVSLRYSLAMIGLCTLAPPLGVTTWLFAADSLPFNLYLTYLAWRFYRQPDAKSSRKLFLFTLIHMPALLLLMIISNHVTSDETKSDTANRIVTKSEILQTGQLNTSAPISS